MHEMSLDGTLGGRILSPALPVFQIHSILILSVNKANFAEDASTTGRDLESTSK